MAPSPLQQRRTHNSLLFQKLLNLRDGASPFTLIIDSLEQSGKPVIREFVRRAKISKSQILFISFETPSQRVGLDIDVFISARGKSLAVLREEIFEHLPKAPTTPSTNPQKALLIIDTLTPLSSNQLTSPHLSTFLSTIISPGTSLLSVYHVDIPTSIETANNAHTNSYAPTPFTTLTYLATSILRIQNLSHVIARKKARDKSLQEPVFGLDEHREGVVTGLDSSKSEERRSVVVEMEARRKSGRGVSVVFVLSPPPPPSKSAVASSTNSASTGRSATSGIGSVILLDDHPLYATAPVTTSGTEEDGKEEVETTFSMGLTEKQRRDRDNVVLPYFDAQKEGGALGAGEGGRILYDMGEEDHEDFDDEEDEI